MSGAGTKRILIACEFSGTVRDAFQAAGWDAWSCDIVPSERPGNHIRGDALEALRADRWDMMIAHPPCTYLCSSGLHWNKRTPGRSELTEQALEFVRALLEAPVPRIALENPVGCISTRIRKPDQKIQPWMFGEDASKGTCLWLKNLPRLMATKIVAPKEWHSVVYASTLPTCDCCGDPFCETHDSHYGDCACVGPTQDGYTYRTIDGFEFASEEPTHPVWSNQTPSGQNRLGPSPTRAAERARTYGGIARAMADQWGRL